MVDGAPEAAIRPSQWFVAPFRIINIMHPDSVN